MFAVYFIRIRRDENNRNSVPSIQQLLLQVEAAQTMHLEIGGKTSRLCNETRLKNSSAEAKLEALYPNDSTSFRTPSRAQASSSTSDFIGQVRHPH
jgi:hypothetical protein